MIQQEKLKNHGYANLTQLESDLKRLVSNAKKYNDKSSVLFADAERIRKIVTSTMPKINPAYNDPNYVPFPTPIPDHNLPQEQTQTPEKNYPEDIDSHNVDADADAEAEDDKSAQPSDQALEKGDEEDLTFEGDTMQLAQDKIISEMIQLRDDRYAYLLIAIQPPILLRYEIANFYQRERSGRPFPLQTGPQLV